MKKDPTKRKSIFVKTHNIDLDLTPDDYSKAYLPIEEFKKVLTTGFNGVMKEVNDKIEYGSKNNYKLIATIGRCGDCGNVDTLYIDYLREETDEEYNKRMARLEKRRVVAQKAKVTAKSKTEKRERALLAKLQTKYKEE